MAFKLTYRDGVADDYGDDTAWAVEDGVLKMGREDGKWTVLVSPSHWATIEVGAGKDADNDDEEKDDDDKESDDGKDRSKKDDDGKESDDGKDDSKNDDSKKDDDD